MYLNECTLSSCTILTASRPPGFTTAGRGTAHTMVGLFKTIHIHLSSRAHCKLPFAAPHAPGTHVGDLAACRAEQISTRPRAYVYHNFLTTQECDHIVALAKPQVVLAFLGCCRESVCEQTCVAFL